MEISFVKHGILLYSYALQGARNHCSGNITHFNEANISDNLGYTSFHFFCSYLILMSSMIYHWTDVNIESIFNLLFSFQFFYAILLHIHFHMEILKSSFRHSIPHKKILDLSVTCLKWWKLDRKVMTVK